MAKESEKGVAYHYFVEKQYTAKAAAKLAGVTEGTMVKWIKKFGWKTEREARALSPHARTANIESVISDLANQRIETSQELKEAVRAQDIVRVGELHKRLASIDDGAAKWNKTLEGARKEGRVHLVTYLDVMGQIFDALREYDESMYLRTIEFQRQHIHDVSAKMERE